MSSDEGDGNITSLPKREQRQINTIRECHSLASLQKAIGTNSAETAYFEASKIWFNIKEKILPETSSGSGIPGDTVVIDDYTYHVHGITHANTSGEGEFLRKHVADYLNSGSVVFCEQGIRPMYFSEFSNVYGIDDYFWARERCEHLPESGVYDDIIDHLEILAGQVRDTAFSMVDSGSHLYGPEFEEALGDIVSDLLMDKEDYATGREFTSYKLSREAAKNPTKLLALQNYYKKRLLPQPIEREWLRRYDRELEIVTHARNERIADYAVYHHNDTKSAHIIVGAAHQPGVVYYLKKHRDGERTVDQFEYY